MNTPSSVVLTSRATRVVRVAITSVVFAIAGLAFAFGFGNAWTLGLQLGVPGWIAPLTGPAVDLSVIALIVSLQYIRTQGFTHRLIGARLLLGFSGLVTLVINTARAVLERQYGRAAFDAVAPLLLIFWGEVGPGLLVLLHGAAPTTPHESTDERDGPEVVPDELGPSPELIAKAYALDAEHRQSTGRPISRDRLRPALGVSNALASELVRLVRAMPRGGDAS